MARLATIDLDWLKGEIARIEKSILSPTASKDAKISLSAMLFEAKLIYGNCTPIEEIDKETRPLLNVVGKVSGIKYGKGGREK